MGQICVAFSEYLNFTDNLVFTDDFVFTKNTDTKIEIKLK